jgi:hypothetical protein
MFAAWWEWLGLDLSVALVNAEQKPLSVNKLLSHNLS